MKTHTPHHHPAYLPHRPSRRRTLLRALALALAVPLLPSHLAAQVFSPVGLELRGFLDSFDQPSGVGTGHQEILIEHHDYHPGISAAASDFFGDNLALFAAAQPGILRASVSGTGSYNFTAIPGSPFVIQGASVTGSAFAYATEQFTLAVPGAAFGKAVTLSFSYYLPGSVSGTGSYSAAMNFAVHEGTPLQLQIGRDGWFG